MTTGGDFNNDGKPDYVLYNASTHKTVVWYLNNNVYIGGLMGRPFLLAGAWWGLRILTGTENLITCCSMRAPVIQRSFICLGPLFGGGWANSSCGLERGGGCGF